MVPAVVFHSPEVFPVLTSAAWQCSTRSLHSQTETPTSAISTEVIPLNLGTLGFWIWECGPWLWQFSISGFAFHREAAGAGTRHAPSLQEVTSGQVNVTQHMLHSL